LCDLGHCSHRTNKAPPTWRSRVRNVLTVNDCFRRIPDPKGGRKGTWLLTNRGKETFQSTYVCSVACLFIGTAPDPSLCSLCTNVRRINCRVKSPLQVHKDARSTHIRRAVSQELRISDAVQVQPAESIQPCFQTHSRVQQPQSAAITFSNSVATPVDVDMAGLSDEEQVTRRGSLAYVRSCLKLLIIGALL
jgi:hypothetical protein